MNSAADAQEPTPDYRRPAHGARGAGTGDWVFVPNVPSVFEAPRPDYDPIGMRFGSWLFYPEMSAAESYDDNIFAQDEGEASDFITTLAPAFRLESDRSVHFLGVEGAARTSLHADETDEDKTEGRASVFGRLDITGDDALFASATYRRSVQDRDDPEDQGGELTKFNRWIGRAGYVHQFARVNVRLDATGESFDFLEEANDDRDRDELHISGRVTYALSPRFTPFVEGGYVDRDFDDAVDDTGVNRDSTEYGAAIGGRVLITDVLFGELSVGVFHTDFDDAALDPITSLGLSGELTWNVTRLTSIIVRAAREDNPTTQAGSSSRIDTTTSLRLEHELLSNLLVSASAAYQNEDFRDIDRTDNRFRLAAGGEFLLNRSVSLFAEYDLERRDSDAAGLDFTRTIFMVGARLQY